MPAVTIVGSGLAGISAATRLMEQGFDITLYEQNNFLGGKLGAHRQQGSLDPHEHCYHMYVNWFNNFWQFMTEIGAADKFMPSPVIGCRLPGEKQTRPYLTNPGSPATVLTNMLNGVAAPADQFLATYSLLDLVGTPSAPGDTLGQTSVSNFFRSKDYSSDGSIAASARTLAEAFASPSYLSSTRSYQTGSSPVAADAEHQRRHLRTMEAIPRSESQGSRAWLRPSLPDAGRKASHDRWPRTKTDTR